jgi:hypothetical protein
MSRYSGVPWDPSPNFTDLHPFPRNLQRVVLHRMAGNFEGGREWLKNPVSEVSSHFAVDNVSGFGVQLVDTGDAAWTQKGYNRNSLSIEIGGQPGDPVSGVAVVTIADIVQQAHEIDGVPLVIAETDPFEGLAYHGQLGEAGGGHPDCPGQIVIDLRPRILELAGATNQEEPMGMATMTPTGAGTWRLHPDGTVYTAGDAQYYGGYVDLPAGEREGTRTFVAVERLGAKMTDGYVLIGDDGSAYRFTGAVWARLHPVG